MNQKTVLVTGGTGFLAVHTILQLLQQGFTVKTTLRSLSRKDEILNALRQGGIIDFSNLSFYEADLLSDEGWDEAARGCDYVLHLASPFVADEPKDENELIIPACDGALRALRAAKEAGVKRSCLPLPLQPLVIVLILKIIFTRKMTGRMKGHLSRRISNPKP